MLLGHQANSSQYPYILHFPDLIGKFFGQSLSFKHYDTWQYSSTYPYVIDTLVAMKIAEVSSWTLTISPTSKTLV